MSAPAEEPTPRAQRGRPCMSCGDKRAVLARQTDGSHLCRDCFCVAFEEDVHRTIVTHRVFRRGERVAIAASGGKDSTVLAHVLSTLNRRHDYGLDLFLLSIDEGIAGYRDDSLETVRQNRDTYGLPLVVVSYKELYGWSMDDVVKASGLRNNCTFCGVFRRQALDRGAVHARADKIVTGHNADDIAETVLMNLLRGDIARLGRCTAIVTGQAPAAAASATNEDSSDSAREASSSCGVHSGAAGPDVRTVRNSCCGGCDKPGGARAPCDSDSSCACSGGAGAMASSSSSSSASDSGSGLSRSADSSSDVVSRRPLPGGPTTTPFKSVPRAKPLKYAYEKEIVLYAYHKRLVYHATECSYSPQAYRCVQGARAGTPSPRCDPNDGPRLHLNSMSPLPHRPPPYTSLLAAASRAS